MPARCPRCIGGNVFIDPDTKVQEYLQCGWSYDPRKKIPMQEYARHSDSTQGSVSSRYRAIAQPVGILDLLVS